MQPVGNTLDADDWTLDENNTSVSLRAVQEVEPPETEIRGWSFEACGSGPQVDCSNITFKLRDGGAHFTHRGFRQSG